MKYRILLQKTDDAGEITEEELIPEAASEPGWRCHHAIWPAWMKPDSLGTCGFCHEPLVPCEIVECPWCEYYLAADEAPAHWREGCDT